LVIPYPPFYFKVFTESPKARKNQAKQTDRIYSSPPKNRGKTAKMNKNQIKTQKEDKKLPYNV